MPQIIPIKDLKNTADISELVHAAKEPIYITKNGYGDMVIMSVEMYESTMKRLNIYRELELSEREIDLGRIKDARQSLGKLREKYEI
jgi:prevent-host-death family protein